MQDNKKKTGAYSQLVGFRRAVPIILMALAVFTALCFVTKNTGALGEAISNGLLGLFSIGAYFIPAALALHAVFYPSDVLKKRTVSRVVFTIITIVTISTLTHTIATMGESTSFSASAFYSGGDSVETGGFVGGVLSFVLTKVFGTVGVIIIAIALFAIYIAYYFSTSRSFLLRLLLKILTSISNFFTGISDKRKKRKEEKERERLEIEHEKVDEVLIPLSEDNFFDNNGRINKIEAPQLEIHEAGYCEEAERRPQLQEKIFHKSVAETYDITNSTASANASQNPRKEARKAVNMDYPTVNSVNNLENLVNKTFFTANDDGTTYDAAQNSTYSADDVFSSNFEPFNLRMNAELSNKPSSRARTETPEPEGITEFSEPVNEITEEDLKKARERADFEMRKKAAIEMQRSQQRAREEIERQRNAQIAQERQSFTVAENNTEKETAAMDFPYSSTVREAEQTPTTTVRNPEPSHSQIFENGEPKVNDYAHFNAASASVSDYSEESTRTEFKQYTNPTAYDTPAQNESYVRDNEENLRVTRSMLDPAFAVEKEETEDTKNAPSASFEFGETDSVAFEFETDGENEDGTPDVSSLIEEDDDTDKPVEIPTEEQNPEVIRQREYFNFLNESEDGDEDEEEEYEDTTVSQESYDSFSSPSEEDEEEDDVDGYAVDEEEEDDEDGDEISSPSFDAPTRTWAPIQPTKPEKPEKDEQAPLERPDYSDYQYPPLDLLIKGRFEEDINQEEEKNQNAEKLVDALSQFNVRISIKGIDRGPRITRYEIVPARGVKVNSVTNLFNDIALSLGVEGMRMEAPIPGKSAIGVEIPNKKPSTVLLRDLVEADEFISASSKTLSCLGKDVTGNPVYADISKMPHVLVAGATGMGKSVCINAILISILYKARPDEVKLIMIDPKKVEFNGYNGIPHLLIPVVTDVKQAAGALMWAVEQMEKRYDLMEALEVRKLDAYNEKVRENPELGEPLPKIIIVIDELNDIMLQVRKPAEDLIMSIAQKARAAGIHLIIGTQRPSVDVITGVIKANIPSRISCKVASYNDSKTILEQAGAEKLLNNGDMLYISAGAPKALRVQGAFVSDGEVTAIMKFLKTQAKGAVYDSQALEEINRAAQKCSKGKGGGDVDDDDDSQGESVGLFSDPKFIEAVEIAIKSRKVSTSLLQRKISIGYSKAAKYIDAMEDQGFVSEQNGSKPREVLISMDEWHELLSRRDV